MGLAAVIWSIWKTRNVACFDHIYPNDPNVVMNHIFIGLIVGLACRNEVRARGNTVAPQLAKVASEFFNRGAGWAPMTRIIGVG